MSIESIVKRRGISELLHFTTNRGALGILASKAIKARDRLANDPFLEKIFYPNAEDRSRDAAWHGFVNLSITDINARFFGICANNWHRDKNFWWAIFSVSPEILLHDGVRFTTTNNMYSGVRRDAGADGLEALFAPRILQWYGNEIARGAAVPANVPTCNQAEVLYPGEVPTEFVRGVYVRSELDADELAGQLAAVGHPNLPITVKPELFGEKK